MSAAAVGPLLDRLARQAGGAPRRWRLRLRSAHLARGQEVAEACRATLAFLGVRVGELEAGQLHLSTRSSGVTDEMIERRTIVLNGEELPLARLGILEMVVGDASNAAPDQRRMLQSILENLDSLFNSDPVESGIDLSELPQVRSSVLNYGVSLGVGQSLSTVKPRQFEAAIAAAISAFEPRLSPDHLHVSMEERGFDEVSTDIRLVIETTLRERFGGGTMRVLTSIDVVDGRVRSRAG